MDRLDRLITGVEALINEDKFKRMVFFVSLLTEYFEKEKINIVIVGGLSVEIYTKNHYTTVDIDLITSGRDNVGELLEEKLGFKKQGRSWYHEELEISIEMPGENLEGSIEKIITVELENSKKVNVIGLEDIIVHRLESATASFRENPEWSDDYGWAKRMYELHKDDKELIDKNYLLSASKDKVVEKIIKGWIKN